MYLIISLGDLPSLLSKSSQERMNDIKIALKLELPTNSSNKSNLFTNVKSEFKFDSDDSKESKDISDSSNDKNKENAIPKVQWFYQCFIPINLSIYLLSMWLSIYMLMSLHIFCPSYWLAIYLSTHRHILDIVVVAWIQFINLPSVQVTDYIYV